MTNETCCDKSPSFLSINATEEIEGILNNNLCILFAIDKKGEIKRIYPNHFDQAKINTLGDTSLTTSLVINTRIPKCDIEEEGNFLKKCFSFLISCCCKSGGRCKSCD